MVLPLLVHRLNFELEVSEASRVNKSELEQEKRKLVYVGVKISGKQPNDLEEI